MAVQIAVSVTRSNQNQEMPNRGKCGAPGLWLPAVENLPAHGMDIVADLFYSLNKPLFGHAKGSCPILDLRRLTQVDTAALLRARNSALRHVASSLSSVTC